MLQFNNIIDSLQDNICLILFNRKFKKEKEMFQQRVVIKITYFLSDGESFVVDSMF